MQQPDIEQMIRAYLPDVVHLSLATAVGNKPWVCEVHFSYDTDLNLYFRSTTDRRHCQEIARNPQVAGNIVTQHIIGQKPRGVYFEGTAELLPIVEQTDEAFVSYCKRMGVGPEILEHAAKGGPRFYKITVSDYYVFDAREATPPQKYHLPRAKR
jgi:uncharacterized protein YhbP (UPF0306 family)